MGSPNLGAELDRPDDADQRIDAQPPGDIASRSVRGMTNQYRSLPGTGSGSTRPWRSSSAPTSIAPISIPMAMETGIDPHQVGNCPHAYHDDREVRDDPDHRAASVRGRRELLVAV